MINSIFRDGLLFNKISIENKKWENLVFIRTNEKISLLVLIYLSRVDNVVKN